MRSSAGLLLALVAVLISACGSSGGSGGGGDEGTALSYLPKDALAAVVIQTDPNAAQAKTALDLVRRFPGGDGVLSQIQGSIESGAVSYDDDVKPLFGHPLAFAATGPTGNRPLLAWRVKDVGAARRLIAKSHARKVGERKGATLYRSAGDTVYALQGDLLTIANSEGEIRAALDRHAAGSGLSSDDLPADLPDDALVRGTGSIAAVLAHASTQSVRLVPWLAAVKRYGFAVTASDSGAGLELRVDTSGGDVQDADVPIATGDATPKVVDASLLAVGLRDLRHVFDFAVRAAGVINPEGTTQFQANLQSLKGFAGVDVQKELIDQLDSDATITTDLNHLVALRATAKDPAIVTRALERLERIVPSALEGVGIFGARVARAGPGFWSVSLRGAVVGAYGVVGGELVAGSGRVADLRALARRPADTLADAKGALAVRMPGPTLARLIGDRLGIPSGLGGLALARLGDLHGSMSATPDEMRGSFKLDVR